MAERAGSGDGQSADPRPTLAPSGAREAGPRDAYRAAGVDVVAGERAVELMREAVASTRRPEVVGGLGRVRGCHRDPGRRIAVRSSLPRPTAWGRRWRSRVVPAASAASASTSWR